MPRKHEDAASSGGGGVARGGLEGDNWQAERGRTLWKRYSLIRQRTIIWSVRARLTDSRRACKLVRNGRRGGLNLAAPFSDAPQEHPSVQTLWRYGVDAMSPIVKRLFRLSGKLKRRLRVMRIAVIKTRDKQSKRISLTFTYS